MQTLLKNQFGGFDNPKWNAKHVERQEVKPKARCRSTSATQGGKGPTCLLNLRETCSKLRAGEQQSAHKKGGENPSGHSVDKCLSTPHTTPETKSEQRPECASLARPVRRELGCPGGRRVPIPDLWHTTPSGAEPKTSASSKHNPEIFSAGVWSEK